MLTSVIKAKMELCGSIKIELPIDIPDHKAREILDAIADVMSDKWSEGKTVRTEKDEFNLARKCKDDLDQQSIFDGQSKPLEADFEVVEQEQRQLPAPLQLLPEGAETPEEDIDTVV